MSAADWSTPEGLKAITESIAATIPGWRALALYAVGLSSASSSPEPEFPHVNPPGAPTTSPGWCSRRWSATTAARRRSSSPPQARGGGRGPCACGGVHHGGSPEPRRLAARAGRAAVQPARTAYAVFVRDVDDPVTSEADAALRALLWPDEADGRASGVEGPTAPIGHTGHVGVVCTRHGRVPIMGVSTRPESDNHGLNVRLGERVRREPR